MAGSKITIETDSIFLSEKELEKNSRIKRTKIHNMFPI